MARACRRPTSAGVNSGIKSTLHFIRHGDALPDGATVFSGTDGYDEMGLGQAGLAQADALAARLLRTLPIACVYASPTRRAYETGAVVAAAFALGIVRDARLREIGLGDESQPATLGPDERARAIRERLEMLAALAVREGSWESVAGVEDIAAVRARVGAAVDDIASRHPGEHVAIVSHAGTINAYLAHVLGVPRDFFVPLRNTSLSSVRIVGGRATLLRLNDCAHLERA